MNVVEKSAEGLSRTFEVVVPASELEAKLTAKIEEIRPEVRLIRQEGSAQHEMAGHRHRLY